jgi:hypothetical protein
MINLYFHCHLMNFHHHTLCKQFIIHSLPILNPIWVLIIGSYTDFVTGSFTTCKFYTANGNYTIGIKNTTNHIPTNSPYQHETLNH